MTVRNYYDRTVELVGGVKYHDDGYIYGEIRCARTGVQEYHTSELELLGDSMVDVHRSADEVFSKESRDSYAHVPVTIGHPKDGVNSTNWKELAVGELSTDTRVVGDWIHSHFMVKDAEGIKQIAGGIDKASMGYQCEVAFIDGRYEQKNIVINHLAFVDNPRSGDNVGIWNDALNWGASPITKGVPIMEFKTVVFGDKAVKIAVDDAQGFEAVMATIKTDNATAIEAKDAVIGELKGKLSDAEAKILSDADIEARVVARSKLVADAKKINPDMDPDGKTEEEMKKEAVAKRFGKDSIIDASDAEISGMFKAALASPAVNDSVRKALGDSPKGGSTTVLDRIAKQNGWVE